MTPPPALWDFSTALWRRPQVERAFLSLQDGVGLDVNLGLAACWLGVQGRRMEAHHWQALNVQVSPWRSQVTERLRQARGFVKAADAMPQPDRAGFSERLLALELESERREQQLICEYVDSAAAIGADPDPSACCLANWYACFNGIKLPVTETAVSEVCAIIGAVCDVPAATVRDRAGNAFGM